MTISMFVAAVLLCEGCRQLGKWRNRWLGVDCHG